MMREDIRHQRRAATRGAHFHERPAARAQPDARFPSAPGAAVLGTDRYGQLCPYFADRRSAARTAARRPARPALCRYRPQTDRQRRERGAHAGLQPVVADAVQGIDRPGRGAGRRTLVVDLGPPDQQRTGQFAGFRGSGTDLTDKKRIGARDQPACPLRHADRPREPAPHHRPARTRTAEPWRPVAALRAAAHGPRPVQAR